MSKIDLFFMFIIALIFVLIVFVGQDELVEPVLDCSCEKGNIINATYESEFGQIWCEENGIKYEADCTTITKWSQLE